MVRLVSCKREARSIERLCPWREPKAQSLSSLEPGVRSLTPEARSFEVYVQAFPNPGGKFQVSTDGGTEPVRARNGRELFYRSGDKMMAVSIDISGGTPKVGKPTLLFQGSFAATGSKSVLRRQRRRPAIPHAPVRRRLGFRAHRRHSGLDGRGQGAGASGEGVRRALGSRPWPSQFALTVVAVLHGARDVEDILKS